MGGIYERSFVNIQGDLRRSGEVQTVVDLHTRNEDRPFYSCMCMPWFILSTSIKQTVHNSYLVFLPLIGAFSIASINGAYFSTNTIDNAEKCIERHARG
jgi:hypothetical protein